MKTYLLLLSFITCISLTAFSQSVQERMTRQQPDCRDVIINASTVLPDLYAARFFDSMQVAIGLMQQFCSESSDEVFTLTLLLHIQQSTFSITEVADTYRFNRLLYGYYVDTNRHSIVYRRYSPFNPWQNNLPQLVQTWARNLLDKPELTATELFICRVFSGEYRNPEAVLKQEKDKYPELYALLQQKYGRDRVEATGVFNVMTGIWLPNRNLKTLGAHPSFGIQLGGRDKKNEVLFTLQFRFLKSANFYTVRRQDSLYQLNHFFGGYIGLDYLRYFYHTTRLEAGVIAGTGYDGFDITSSTKDEESYLKPHSISSLNVNGGLRFNYFLTSRFSIGLLARYNAIWYRNRGGTNLNGHPVSIDLVFGR